MMFNLINSTTFTRLLLVLSVSTPLLLAAGTSKTNNSLFLRGSPALGQIISQDNALNKVRCTHLFLPAFDGPRINLHLVAKRYLHKLVHGFSDYDGNSEALVPEAASYALHFLAGANPWARGHLQEIALAEDWLLKPTDGSLISRQARIRIHTLSNDFIEHVCCSSADEYFEIALFPAMESLQLNYPYLILTGIVLPEHGVVGFMKQAPSEEKTFLALKTIRDQDGSMLLIKGGIYSIDRITSAEIRASFKRFESDHIYDIYDSSKIKNLVHFYELEELNLYAMRFIHPNRFLEPEDSFSQRIIDRDTHRALWSSVVKKLDQAARFLDRHYTRMRLSKSDP